MGHTVYIWNVYGMYMEGNVYVYGMYRKCRLTTHPHIPVVTCDKWPLSVVGAVGVVLLNLEEF